MTLFSKKHGERLLADRLHDFRRAVDAAMTEHKIPSAAAVAVLEDIVRNAKYLAAVTAPLQSSRPIYHSGNLPEKPSLRDLARKIAGR